MKNKLIMGVLAGAITLSVAVSPVFAQVTDYVTEKESLRYEYDVNDLRKSIVAGVTGGQATLYNRYFSETLIALKDDKNGYIDVNDIRKALVNASILGDKFNVDDYTESEDAKKVEIDKVVKLDKDGNSIEDSFDKGFRVISIN